MSETGSFRAAWRHWLDAKPPATCSEHLAKRATVSLQLAALLGSSEFS